MFALVRVLAGGAAKYGDTNWHGISATDHLNHMLAHTYAHLAGDTQDDHLTHMLCRAMMAVAIHHKGQERNCGG